MKLTKAQTKFLNLYVKGTWNLNSEGFVDVVGDFNCSGKDIKDFMGIKFGKISGSFCCSKNKLTSLGGTPQEVGGSFNCLHNQLTSLEGAPQDVGGHFICCYNKLTSLKGAPQKVGGYFDCSSNQITSLVGTPQEVGGDFSCSGPLEEAFELIYKKLKLGIPYGVALLASKSKISKKEWDKLDKSSIEGIDPEEADNIEKGGSFLSRVGIF
jgi:hypothetical protein